MDPWPVYVIELATFIIWVVLYLLVCGFQLLVVRLVAVFRAITESAGESIEPVHTCILVSWVHVALWVLRCLGRATTGITTTKGQLSTTSAWYFAFTAVELSPF